MPLILYFGLALLIVPVMFLGLGVFVEWLETRPEHERIDDWKSTSESGLW